ncbi:hypothetical protein SO802_014535 [Lithocarpus litseifolius]|uniref:DUF4283 domain-containing protein n=1 Tax=Lithocarpus litseifolius TaxID=425828 RepID=A0AAW2CSG0_9ROSI
MGCVTFVSTQHNSFINRVKWVGSGQPALLTELAVHFLVGFVQYLREGGEFQFEKTAEVSTYTIVAKFLTKHALNTEAIIKTFNSIWSSKNGFKVRNVGNHILLFVFDNEEEVERIFEGEPWSFDKHLVLIQRYDNSIPVRELVFDQDSLWVQVHDIPAQFSSRDVAEKLCEAVGEVRKDVNIKEIERGEVMRIRVRVDVTLPLCRGRVFSQKDGSKGWVSFNNGTLRHEDQEYGPWLRASPLPMHKNLVIVVPGYYETKRKELEAGGRKGENGRKTDQRATQTAARGGAHGGGGKEFQFQNNTLNDGAVTGVTEVNADRDRLEGHSIRGGIANQGEVFAEKLNEIDQELKRFDLEKVNQGGHVTEETPIISECLFHEVTEESRIPQNLMDTRELLSEPTHHVPLSSENPKEDWWEMKKGAHPQLQWISYVTQSGRLMNVMMTKIHQVGKVYHFRAKRQMAESVGQIAKFRRRYEEKENGEDKEK